MRRLTRAFTDGMMVALFMSLLILPISFIGAAGYMSPDQNAVLGTTSSTEDESEVEPEEIPIEVLEESTQSTQSTVSLDPDAVTFETIE